MHCEAVGQELARAVGARLKIGGPRSVGRIVELLHLASRAAWFDHTIFTAAGRALWCGSATLTLVFLCARLLVDLE